MKTKANTSKSTLARSRFAVILVFLGFCILVARLADLQLINPDENRNQAMRQYTAEVTLNAKRGTIFDRTGQKLAVSTTVYTVFISPKDIKDDKQAEFIADNLSRILNVDKQMILDRAEKKKYRYQVVKKGVEGDEEKAVREFIEKEKLGYQIGLEESTKRYYPFDNFAGQVIGSVGGENRGLNGIELTYNDLLSGIDGKSVHGQDSHGNELPFRYENYIDPINGTDIMLTLDYNVQNILMKYLMRAYDDHKPRQGVRGIIMDVETGEILAMANYPDYNLNQPGKLSPFYEEKYNAFAADPEKTDEEKTKYQNDLMFDMWKNKTVTELYYPGSTFKPITAAAALEEGTSHLTDTYNCTYKGITIMGQTYHCHSTPHGHENFSEALVNSCNPALIQIGQTLGDKLFMEYFDSFGYTGTAGSDVLGERTPIYHKSLTPVDLATASFGQNMKISMLQHLRALCAIANGGRLVTPHLLKGFVDEKGMLIETDKFDSVKRVISEKTANQICEILTNSTKNAAVPGYDIITKTGTTQKLDVPKKDDGQYWMVSSCVSFAPAENPKVAVLVVIDEPTGPKYFGSLLAAPVISEVLSEVLPYLGIEPARGHELEFLYTPDYRGIDVNTAKQAIEALGLKCTVVGDGNAVTEQTPKGNAVLTKGGRIVIYTGNAKPEKTAGVPNFVGMTPTQALGAAASAGINLNLRGIYKDDLTCKASEQSVPSGEKVYPGESVTVKFIYQESIE